VKVWGAFFFGPFFLLAALLLVPARAFAQWQAPSLSAHLTPEVVEVGEPFTVVLSASVGAGAETPSDPRLTVPAGMAASAPSISTQSQVSIVNGRMTQSTGISATWRVTPSRE
jgi:hypothetical protein